MQKEIFESLVVVDDYLKKLIDAIEQAVLYFNRQEEDQGLPLLVQIIDGLSWTIDAVFHLKSFINNGELEPDIEQLNSLLRALLSAMENEDFVLIGDILKYEILEVVASWHTMMERIRTAN